LIVTEAIIVALISFIGTGIGSFGGVLSTQKIVKYRLSKLEEKVDKHNHVIERVSSIELLNKMFEKRIEKLENKVNG